MSRHETVDQFIAAATVWKAELAELRSLLRSTELQETVIYTIDGKNVVGLADFKAYFGLWFFQGALLADPKQLLINAQAGKTKAQRQLRFRSMAEIDRKLIRAYVKEAIGLAKQGVGIKPDRNKPLDVPPELQAALRARRKAKTSFEALSPGKRREYAEYVASAKRDDTRQKRIDKILPMIESGGGLNDRYRTG